MTRRIRSLTGRNRLPLAYRVLLTTSLLIAIAFLIGLHPAFAADPSADASIKNIGNNVVTVPVLAATVAYALGTVFTAIGLLRLRAWISDSERNKLNAAIFRLFVGALLIFLPHMFIIVNNMIYGQDATTNGSNVQVKPPQLFVYKK